MAPRKGREHRISICEEFIFLSGEGGSLPLQLWGACAEGDEVQHEAITRHHYLIRVTWNVRNAATLLRRLFQRIYSFVPLIIVCARTVCAVSLNIYD